jgi:hypothetical protein
MTKSCRQQIAEAVLTALAAIPDQAVAGGGSKSVTIEANRRVPITDDVIPYIGLFEDTEIPANDFSSEDAYQLSFMVQGAVLGTGGDAVGRANALRAEVIKALFADRTLGIGVRFLELSDTGDWIGVDIDSAETEGFLFGFHVGYATREGDPFTFEP